MGIAGSSSRGGFRSNASGAAPDFSGRASRQSERGRSPFAAGVGRITLEIWADPALTRNVYRIEVESDFARFSMSIENIPSENPKTSCITALSVIAYLRKQGAALRVGTSSASRGIIRPTSGCPGSTAR
jgi:hypothetical protein